MPFYKISFGVQLNRKLDPAKTESLAARIRIHALTMTAHAGASHIGTCLSLAEILAVLYCDILQVDPQHPKMKERDWLILSKGHGAAIYYAVLAEMGFFPKAWLKFYGINDSKLSAHVNQHNVPGVEFSTGSLGHGLPVACGIAFSLMREAKDQRVFVVLSDGELDEGSNWEAALFASHHQLSNLTIIVDYNKYQAFGPVDQIINLEPITEKFEAFGWSAQRIDGHNIYQLHQSLSSLPASPEKPSVILADTIKGKGVSFMENSLKWHYQSPDPAELEKAIAEIKSSL